MCHWTEELLERTEDCLLRAQIEHACVVDCIWDSEAEYNALCTCYKRYDPQLLYAVEQAGVLHQPGTTTDDLYLSCDDKTSQLLIHTIPIKILDMKLKTLDPYGEENWEQ